MHPTRGSIQIDSQPFRVLLFRRRPPLPPDFARVCHTTVATIGLRAAAARVCCDVGGPRIDECHGEGPSTALLLTIFGGAQLSTSTPVSPLRRDVGARPGAARQDGAAVRAHSQEEGALRLVVLAAEVGGRWSQETVTVLLLRCLVRRVTIVVSWLHRWARLLACSTAHSCALFAGTVITRELS